MPISTSIPNKWSGPLPARPMQVTASDANKPRVSPPPPTHCSHTVTKQGKCPMKVILIPQTVPVRCTVVMFISVTTYSCVSLSAVFLKMWFRRHQIRAYGANLVDQKLTAHPSQAAVPQWLTCSTGTQVMGLNSSPRRAWNINKADLGSQVNPS